MSMFPHVKTQPLIPTGEGDTRKIAFVGLDRAGKTTTLKRLSRGVLVSTKPTYGFNAETFNFLGIKFNVFDLGGQVAFHAFWDRFLPEQEAIVYFIDAADTRRFAQVRLALNKTLTLAKQNTTIMILANKQDLPEALDIPDLIKALDLRLASKAKQLQIFAVSAKTGVGIYEAFQWLASALEIDVGQQKCTLFGFYIFERDVGVPLVTSLEDSTPGGSLLDLKSPLISQDPALITALYSAIGNFASEMTESELKTVTFQSQQTGQRFQITSVRYEQLVCILITAGDDSLEVTTVLGEAILSFAYQKIDFSSPLPTLDNFHLLEVLDIISPFLRNSRELKDSLKPKEKKSKPLPSTLKPSDFVSDDQSAPESQITSLDQVGTNETEITTSKMSDTPASTFSEELKTEEKISEDTTKLSSDLPSPRPSSTPDKALEEKSEEDRSKQDDEMFIYRMSVAERIKYLRQQRSRLKED